MASSIRDITFQLRQGRLIALADETGWSLAADPVNDTAVEQLLTLQNDMPAAVQPTVLIQDANQLVLYVGKMPDIAYDLVEFAEKPLTVVFDHGKNLSELMWKPVGAQTRAQELSPLSNDGIQPTGEVAIRRSLNGDIQRLIGGFGRGLLTIPFESLALPPTAEALVTDRFGSLPGMPRRPRIMRLGANGEVSFIRK
jgi:L-threonylcarbamoyladenylate synthase